MMCRRLITLVKPQEDLGDEDDNETCFHLAAEHNAYSVLPLFLQVTQSNYRSTFRAICNITNKAFNTPIMEAAKNDHAEAFSVLLTQGDIDMDFKDAEGMTIE